MRIEHDYRRGGALAYLAAWAVHRGQVTGRCDHTTGIAPFSQLVQQVMTAEPYARLWHDCPRLRTAPLGREFHRG